MTADMIRDISNMLERHQAAFDKEGGFEHLSQGGLRFYLGYGRELALPDGQLYEAYVKSDNSSLQIKFVGPRKDVPSVKVDLGNIQFIPQGEGIRVDGNTDHYAYEQRHNFPEVTELVKPFGAWASDGLARELDRKKTNYRIRGAVSEKCYGLMESILEGGEIDKLTLIEQSTIKLTDIISKARQAKAPEIMVPDVEETAFLEEFINNPDNTTAAYVPCTEPAVGFQVINVPGPLLLS